MTVNFKTYQIALKSMKTLKQQADEFSKQINLDFANFVQFF